MDAPTTPPPITLDTRPVPPVKDGGRDPAAGTPNHTASRVEDSLEHTTLEDERARETQQLPVVVGVGASAGGLEALTRLLVGAPKDIPFAFVVVQHLSPDYKSMVAELLGRQTGLAVQRAEDGLRLQRGNVYVIEPQTDLTVEQGRLRVAQQNRDGGLQLPIDALFSSLATAYGSDAIAVVLSGTGSDGTRGARAVKEAGGIVISQELSTCGFDGMPAALSKPALRTSLWGRVKYSTISPMPKKRSRPRQRTWKNGCRFTTKSSACCQTTRTLTFPSTSPRISSAASKNGCGFYGATARSNTCNSSDATKTNWLTWPVSCLLGSPGFSEMLRLWPPLSKHW